MYDEPLGVIESVQTREKETTPEDGTVIVVCQPVSVVEPEYSGCALPGEFSDTVILPANFPPNGLSSVSEILQVAL